MNSIFGIISFVISIIALVVSLINFRINYLKYAIDKSNLKIGIKQIIMDGLTAAYPSMENDQSKYKIVFDIKNTGYKQEALIKINTIYANGDSKFLELNKIIEPKKQEELILEF